MAHDETVEERNERVSNESRELYEKEGQEHTDAAVDAREDEPQAEGFETWEQYREHAANVPGVFGDTDTSGTAPEVDSVITKNEELGGVSVAEVDASSVDGSDEDEQEEATNASGAEAKRQLDIEGPQPSAQEVDENAEDRDDDDDEDNNKLTF